MRSQEFLNALQRIQKIAQRSIVVQGINDISQIFAHVAVNVIRLLQKLRRLIDQIGSQYLSLIHI